MLSAEVDARIDVSAADVLQAHRDRVKDAAKLGVAVADEKVPHDTGMLEASGFGPEWRGEDMVFGYTARQAAPMEFGTEPGHQPPTRPLVEWAQRIGKDAGFGYYVARVKIPQEGIDPQPYLRPAAERMGPWLDNHGLNL